MNHIQAVDEAVGLYLQHQRARGSECVSFSPRAIDPFMELATGRKWTPDQVTGAFMAHRQAQGKTNSKRKVVHRLACRGYGPTARWWVLKDGDGDYDANRRASVDHNSWVIGDMADRVLSDFTHELNPAAEDTEVASVIRAMHDTTVAQLQALLATVGVMVDKFGTQQQELDL